MATALKAGARIEREICDNGECWVVRISRAGVSVKRKGKRGFAGPVTPASIESVYWKQEAARREAEKLDAQGRKLRKNVRRGVLKP